MHQTMQRDVSSGWLLTQERGARVSFLASQERQEKYERDSSWHVLFVRLYRTDLVSGEGSVPLMQSRGLSDLQTVHNSHGRHGLSHCIRQFARGAGARLLDLFGAAQLIPRCAMLDLALKT